MGMDTPSNWRLNTQKTTETARQAKQVTFEKESGEPAEISTGVSQNLSLNATFPLWQEFADMLD
jgi:hypothetical protein